MKTGRWKPRQTLPLAGLALCALTGCLPIPHTEQMSPAVDGMLTRSGIPQVGTQLRLSVRLTPNHVCPDPDLETTTDAAGHFHFRPVRQFFLYAELLGDPIWSYKLCVLEEGQWRELHRDSGIPRPPSVEVDTLSCDLATFRPNEDYFASSGILTACRSVTRARMRSLPQSSR